MTYLHLLEDSGTIVGDNDLTVGGDKHLVHTLGSKRGLHELSHSGGSHDVGLKFKENKG